MTEDDYRQAALDGQGVAGAVASFRWTGSWYTVFVGDRSRRSRHDPDRRARPHDGWRPTFRQSVVDVLDRYRLAGYDLEVRRGPVRAAGHQPSQLCLKPGFFRGDVVEAVLEALAGPPALGHGAAAACSMPANLTFAQPVYLSQVYAAVEAVEGVDSADVLVFRRHGRLPAGELEQGFIPIGAVGDRPARQRPQPDGERVASP